MRVQDNPHWQKIKAENRERIKQHDDYELTQTFMYRIKHLTTAQLYIFNCFLSLLLIYSKAKKLLEAAMRYIFPDDPEGGAPA